MKILMAAGADWSNAHQQVGKLFSQNFTGFLLQVEVEFSFCFPEVLAS